MITRYNPFNDMQWNKNSVLEVWIKISPIGKIIQNVYIYNILILEFN